MREEATGWRDEEISRRHREYGMNVPAVDVDFLLVEYDYGKPRAIIDYKRATSTVWKRDGANLRASSRLYDEDGNQLPFFVARYQVEPWYYYVHAMNDAARAFMDRLGVAHEVEADEYTFVRFLYALRGRQMPALAIFADLVAP